MTPPLSVRDESKSDVEKDLGRLLSWIHAYPDAVVAFSGGVDSAVVAAACYQALGDAAVAVTGVGEAVSQADLESARHVCKQMGIRHVELTTREIDDSNYVRNDSQRCYHCKSHLYQSLRQWATENGFTSLFSGTNHDDLGDYRPGLQAASEQEVIAPLAALGITKSRVRELAKLLRLDVADKPASPCLASRIAYGQPVTTQALRSIESMEELLRSLGFMDVRVRLHADRLLRLEIHESDWNKLFDANVRAQLKSRSQQFGFEFLTMDLMSRQSGSLNRLLPVIDQP